MSRQLLVRGGPVLTQDPADPVVDAMLVENGLVVATGAKAQAGARAGAETLDLDGGFVTPGFIDAHNHFVFSVIAELGTDCRTPPVHTIDQLLDELRRAAARTPKGQWVRGFGYNEVNLTPGRHPTLAELDRAVPDNPLVIAHQSGHMCAANTLALRAGGILESSGNPANGLVDRDRRGRPTGVLHEQAAEMVDVPARSAILEGDPDACRRAAHAVARRFAALGLTTICDPCVQPMVEPFYDELSRDDDFPLLIIGLGIGADGMFAPPTERAENRPGPGENGFRVSGVKLFADGGEQCAVCMSKRGAIRTAFRIVRNSIRHRTLMPARLAAAPISHLGRDGRIHSGIKFYGDGELAGLLERTTGHGLAAAVHAMGNEAIDQVLGAIESARRRAPDDSVFRMEHAMMPAEESFARMGEVGMVAVVQPRFVHDFGLPMIMTGTNREFRVLAFRDLMDHGVVLAGSSDAPVVDPAVLPAIESAVTRRTAEGDVLDGDQALSVDEALAMYTTGAASVLGLAGRHGSLAEGKAADFVVLGSDPRATEPDRIGAIPVEATFRAGRRVHPG